MLALRQRLRMQHLGRDVAVLAAKQKRAERHALARRPQAGLAQALCDARLQRRKRALGEVSSPVPQLRSSVTSSIMRNSTR